MIALAGKQRQMRLIPIKALDQPADTEWIKVADTKGCLLFATGVMRPTATTSTILSGSFCLCVAVKRQVIFRPKMERSLKLNIFWQLTILMQRIKLRRCETSGNFMAVSFPTMERTLSY